MKLHISPCPNDTFTFHAMIHGLVDTEGLTFEPVFDDIDALNQAAADSPGNEEIIKISYAALPETSIPKPCANGCTSSPKSPPP